LKIQPDRVAVEGISSGADMATQMHIAYSGTFKSCGLFASAPYWCAMNNEDVALTSCCQEPELIKLQMLYDKVTSYAEKNLIDDPKNLTDSKVWMYTGKLDTVVKSGVVEQTHAFYENYVPTDNIAFVNNISSEHAWITNDYGNLCPILASPYISNCHFDGAFAMLQWFYPNSTFNAPAKSVNKTNLITFDQSNYTPNNEKPSKISLGDEGFFYVPESCNTQPCGLHVAFHGCLQSYSTVGFDFVLNNGLNQWAETNNMAVLYPQAAASDLMPSNPEGCWDWWGYTGDDYASNTGDQMVTIKNMVDAIMGSK